MVKKQHIQRTVTLSTGERITAVTQTDDVAGYLDVPGWGSMMMDVLPFGTGTVNFDDVDFGSAEARRRLARLMEEVRNEGQK